MRSIWMKIALVFLLCLTLASGAAAQDSEAASDQKDSADAATDEKG